MKNLAPCPFCGSTELMLFCDPDEGRDNSGPSRRVQCAGCNVETPFYSTEAEAIAAWNRRAPLSAVGQKAGTVEDAACPHNCEVGGVCLAEHAGFPKSCPAPSVAEAAEPVAWRCFHCDETFTKEWDARAHFGRDEGCTPACQIKGAEGGLVSAIRRAEQDAADAWAAIHNETTDAAKAYHAQTARHREQLIAIEQIGYDRGLRDGSVDLRQIEEMLEAGQGDDDGMQILPDFDDGMSTVAKVEDCLHLLEKRRDVISAYQQDREQ